MTSDMLWHIVEAIGLGVGAGGLLWLARGFAPVQRLSLWIWLGVVTFGVYRVVQGSGLPNEFNILKVVFAIGIMLAAQTILQLFDVLLWDYFLGQRRHLAIPRLLVDLFNFVVLIVVALAVLSNVFNADLNALLVTSTVLSAVIGLSLQDVLISVISGVALQIERPFMVGDWVRINGETGLVTQMNWRTITLLTRANHNVILPNATITKQDIANFSRPNLQQRQQVEVGVAYAHPPGLVKDVLGRAASEAVGVLTTPPPEVIVVNYGDFAVVYQVRYWINNYAQAEQITDAVMTRIWYNLKRAEMSIPFPIREITMRTLAEDHEARAQAKERQEIFAALRPLAVFAPLSDKQIEQLALGASLQRYTAHEALVRQGEAGDSLFVIKVGRVRVDVKNEMGLIVTVTTLGHDEFFGEMSLLTGEPRSASVIAITETEVVIVDKPDFASVLATDTTGILEAISAALEVRVRQRDAAAAGTSPLIDQQAPQRAVLLNRIKKFFGVGG